MQVVVNELVSSRSYVLNVDPCSLVKDVKQQVMQKANFPIEDQKLSINGKVLRNHKTLKEYNIGPDSAILLVLNSQNSAAITLMRETETENAMDWVFERDVGGATGSPILPFKREPDGLVDDLDSHKKHKNSPPEAPLASRALPLLNISIPSNEACRTESDSPLPSPPRSPTSTPSPRSHLSPFPSPTRRSPPPSPYRNDELDDTMGRKRKQVTFSTSTSSLPGSFATPPSTPSSSAPSTPTSSAVLPSALLSSAAKAAVVTATTNTAPPTTPGSNATPTPSSNSTSTTKVTTTTTTASTHKLTKPVPPPPRPLLSHPTNPPTTDPLKPARKKRQSKKTLLTPTKEKEVPAPPPLALPQHHTHIRYFVDFLTEARAKSPRAAPASPPSPSSSTTAPSPRSLAASLPTPVLNLRAISPSMSSFSATADLSYPSRYNPNKPAPIATTPPPVAPTSPIQHTPIQSTSKPKNATTPPATPKSTPRTPKSPTAASAPSPILSLASTQPVPSLSKEPSISLSSKQPSLSLSSTLPAVSPKPKPVPYPNNPPATAVPSRKRSPVRSTTSPPTSPPMPAKKPSNASTKTAPSQLIPAPITVPITYTCLSPVPTPPPSPTIAPSVSPTRQFNTQSEIQLPVLATLPKIALCQLLHELACGYEETLLCITKQQRPVPIKPATGPSLSPSLPTPSNHSPPPARPRISRSCIRAILAFPRFLFILLVTFICYLFIPSWYEERRKQEEKAKRDINISIAEDNDFDVNSWTSQLPDLSLLPKTTLTKLLLMCATKDEEILHHLTPSLPPPATYSPLNWRASLPPLSSLAATQLRYFLFMFASKCEQVMQALCIISPVTQTIPPTSSPTATTHTFDLDGWAEKLPPLDTLSSITASHLLFFFSCCYEDCFAMLQARQQK